MITTTIHRGIAEVKLSLPSPSGTPPDDPRAQAFARSSLQVQNCSVVGQGKCDIDKRAFWPKPVEEMILPSYYLCLSYGFVCTTDAGNVSLQIKISHFKRVMSYKQERLN